MFSNIIKAICVILLAGLFCQTKLALAMGGKPDIGASVSSIDSAPVSNITLKELANTYWPDSDATTVQQENMLKNILGKAVVWDITVAEVQRDGTGYLVQGRSDKDMIGTFSYITPKTESESNKIQSAGRGSTLKIKGVVSDFQMRHIVLKPAQVVD